MPEYSEKLDKIQAKISEELDWWIEVRTDKPSCIYYFGAFYSFTAAALAQHGYIQDLQDEDAKIISIKIKQCQPQQLTVEIENKALHPLSNGYREKDGISKRRN